MKTYSELFAEEYNTQRDQWEKTLKSELKMDEVSSKMSKRHLDLGAWPTLCLEAPEARPLPSRSEWKKASQTYVNLDGVDLGHFIREDLAGGVRVFFFYQDLISDAQWSVITDELTKFSRPDEIEVYLLGKKRHTHPGLKIIDDSLMMDALEVQAAGGHNVLELAVLTSKLIDGLEDKKSYMGIYLDSHFFKNIAKVRALKLLSQKVLEASESSKDIKIVTLNSYREWTLFERYSNMLRNDVQVASGYISGADTIQSSGYQVVFDLETEDRSAEHLERSLRMARNTGHIMGLESMLGIVEDAAYGSFHLETLSHRYAEEAWKLMQVMIKMDPSERTHFIQEESKKVVKTRSERVETRKDVLAGMNDFPDGKEVLGVSLSAPHSYRVARGFEELRLKVEGLKVKPTVEIILEGDYAALNGRVNFIKNYFELMGLEVSDPIHSKKVTGQKIIVLCAADADYEKLAQTYKTEPARAKFVAGKVDVPGFESIFVGQNVFQVLSNLLAKIEV